jgi:hypothetical protein
VDSLRLGAMPHDPESHAARLRIYQDVVTGLTTPNVAAARADRRDYNVDVQHLYDGGGLRIQSGALAARQDQTVETRYFVPGPPPFSSQEQTGRQLVLYSYAYFDPLPILTVTAGASFDHVDSAYADEDAANPKLGIIWRPTPRTTVRAAAFETLYGSLSTSTQNLQPRLEPVQVAGFTQLLFGGAADQTTVRGVAVEQELSPTLFIGWQADTRETETILVRPADTLLIDLRERAQRAYVYWLPSAQISVTARYEDGRYDSEALSGARLFS